jgi:hypothetical protein
MQETVGAQLFGNWYSVVGWSASAALFAYFAIVDKNLSQPLRTSLPPFLQDRLTNVVLASGCALAAVGKFMHWW